jgi:hypothetical protein
MRSDSRLEWVTTMRRILHRARASLRGLGFRSREIQAGDARQRRVISVTADCYVVSVTVNDDAH